MLGSAGLVSAVLGAAGWISWDSRVRSYGAGRSGSFISDQTPCAWLPVSLAMMTKNIRVPIKLLMSSVSLFESMVLMGVASSVRCTRKRLVFKQMEVLRCVC